MYVVQYAWHLRYARKELALSYFERQASALPPSISCTGSLCTATGLQTLMGAEIVLYN